MTDPTPHDVGHHLVTTDTEHQDTGGNLAFENNFADVVAAGNINLAFEESSTDPLPNETIQQNGGCDFNGNTNSEHAKGTPDGAVETNTTISISRPVVYDNRGGHTVVLQERVMTTQPDGSRSIQTREIPDRGQQFQRPLRPGRIMFIKVFSVIAAVIFFPTGIPACYYAFKTKKAFDEGLLQGNIDKAIKYATRAERLVIFSIILAIVAGALALAMWERSVNARSYTWHPGVLVAG